MSSKEKQATNQESNDLSISAVAGVKLSRDHNDHLALGAVLGDLNKLGNDDAQM